MINSIKNYVLTKICLLLLCTYFCQGTEKLIYVSNSEQIIPQYRQILSNMDIARFNKLSIEEKYEEIGNLLFFAYKIEEFIIEHDDNIDKNTGLCIKTDEEQYAFVRNLIDVYANMHHQTLFTSKPILDQIKEIYEHLPIIFDYDKTSYSLLLKIENLGNIFDSHQYLSNNEESEVFTAKSLKEKIAHMKDIEHTYNKVLLYHTKELIDPKSIKEETNEKLSLVYFAQNLWMQYVDAIPQEEREQYNSLSFAKKMELLQK